MSLLQKRIADEICQTELSHMMSWKRQSEKRFEKKKREKENGFDCLNGLTEKSLSLWVIQHQDKINNWLMMESFFPPCPEVTFYKIINMLFSCSACVWHQPISISLSDMAIFLWSYSVTVSSCCYNSRAFGKICTSPWRQCHFLLPSLLWVRTTVPWRC